MATSGPRNCGTAADDATVGTASWTNPTNAQGASDSVDATVAMASTTSHYLKCTNFGHSIPAGATINGVSYSFHRKATVNNPTDSAVRFVNTGTIGTINKSAGAAWPSSYEDKVFGSASDVWDGSLTATVMNAATTGVVISATGSGTVNVDSVTSTVTYTPAGGGMCLGQMGFFGLSLLLSTVPYFWETNPVGLLVLRVFVSRKTVLVA